jgi:hypothetical protein
MMANISNGTKSSGKDKVPVLIVVAAGAWVARAGTPHIARPTDNVICLLPGRYVAGFMRVVLRPHDADVEDVAPLADGVVALFVDGLVLPDRASAGCGQFMGV